MPKLPALQKKYFLFAGIAVIAIGVVYALGYSKVLPVEYNSRVADAEGTSVTTPVPKPKPVLDTAAYDAKLLALANNPAPKVVPAPVTPSPTTTTTPTTVSVPTTSAKPIPPPAPTLWPVKTAYPKAGALLPFNRIIAYYGNFYSKKMGVLGEYPTDVMLAMLQTEKKNWEAADPTTPVIQAIDYIAITAQASAGFDGKYRARMPYTEIDKAVALADQIHGIVFLDLQVGLSDVQTEIPLLEKYLKMPEVHLALDPEFSMKTGAKPGTVIGSLDATDINFTARYLAKLVQDNDLPPKILVIHRFTEHMVTNYQNITPLPEVQVVMDMDGWGFGAKKINTYKQVVASEPVQFTGFKLFYKNDLKAPSTRLLTPAEVLNLTPRPIYIQYQ